MSSSYKTYTVRSGDNLSKIAKLYNTTWQTLVNLNKSRYPSLTANPNYILVGWVLSVPTVGAGGSSMPSSTVTSTTSVKFQRNLQYRSPMMTGDDVLAVQKQLQILGYTLEADGIFGTKTQEAVRSFQRSAGLVVDGIVGEKTWNALFPSGKSENIISDSSDQNSPIIIPSQTLPPPIKKVPASIASYDPTSLGAVCYIIQLQTGCWCPLPTVPEQVRMSVQANWDTINVLGRSSQYKSYQGTSSRAYSFSMDLHADMLWTRSGDYGNDGETDLLPIINFLEGLSYPEYSVNTIKPPVIVLRIADSYYVRGVPTSVDITKSLPIRKMLRGSQEGKRIYTNYSVNLNIVEVPLIPRSASEINEIGSYGSY